WIARLGRFWEACFRRPRRATNFATRSIALRYCEEEQRSQERRWPARQRVLATRPLAPDLAVALHDVFERRQLAQAHRPPGVELLRADPDLGTEAELLPVHEPGRRVHQHRGGIHLAREPRRRLEI